MKKDKKPLDKRQIFVKVVALILASLMILSVVVSLIFAIIG